MLLLDSWNFERWVFILQVNEKFIDQKSPFFRGICSRSGNYLGYFSIRVTHLDSQLKGLMGMNIERYKGIEFVRISSMSKEQQLQVWESFERGKIIKIVTGDSLMNDCILYNDFAAWQAKSQAKGVTESPGHRPDMLGKLAFE